MPNRDPVSNFTYAGMALVSMATIVFEVMLTRIFSVTMWNHLAFVAVSVAMFGMTVGAVLVYLFEKPIARCNAKTLLAWSSLLFALTAILAFHAHLLLHTKAILSAQTLPVLTATYAIAAVPFTLSGACISLVLTKFSQRVSRLYSADLIGAAVGCLILGFILEFSDGPTAIYAAAFIAAIAAWCFARDAGALWTKRISITATALLAIFIGFNICFIATNAGVGIIPLSWNKGHAARNDVVWEHWNSYSRVQIYGNGQQGYPYFWGPSAAMPEPPVISRYEVEIDASADTPLTGFDGDLSKHQYLEWDVTNVAHSVQKNADVLVIGSGGGRDLLSALYFHQKSVRGVEMNSSIVSALTGPFAPFSGNLATLRGVTVVNDEARSYLTRAPDRFDLIEISLVDTWAATAAGAFVLSENGLYTEDSWQMFLEHLNPGGVLSVSRWYTPENPIETQRLLALANRALRRIGVDHPRDHLALIANAPDDVIEKNAATPGVSTLLVCRDPFTPDQLNRLRDFSAKHGFEILLDPSTSVKPELAMLAETDDMQSAAKSLSPGAIPPTDDKPFFFQTETLGDIFKTSGWTMAGASMGLRLMACLFLFVVILSLIFIIIPVALKRSPDPSGNFYPLTIYFTGIGLGFMTIEMAQLQRLVLLLGHPAYSLNTVLFTLLIFSGIGSLLTRNVQSENLGRAMLLRWLLLLIVLTITGLSIVPIVRLFAGSTTPVRIAVAVAILAPSGFFMGMAFPLGMKWASRHSVAYLPWLWGINGAASVCASVLTVIISMTQGITIAWWTGCAFYGIAALASIAIARTPREAIAVPNAVPTHS